MKRSLAVILFAMSMVAAMAGSVRADDGADEAEGNARPKLDGEIKELIRRIDRVQPLPDPGPATPPPVFSIGCGRGADVTAASAC